MATVKISASIVVVFLLNSQHAFAADADLSGDRVGQVRFEPVADEEHVVPEPFRLPAQTFSFKQVPEKQYTGSVTVSKVTFPSPV
ncbi:MAG TPA: hypothetical protein VLK33_03775, partial [Terriglobales bacterium]|nr:hypothetical protein [Terriglobales bacterium]